MNQLVVGSIVMGVYKCIMQVHVYVYTCRYELAESVDLYCSGLVQWNRENQEHTHKYAQNVPADACNRTTTTHSKLQRPNGWQLPSSSSTAAPAEDKREKVHFY